MIMLLITFIFFFFFSSRRRHTRSLCDWSSDVCSSDLAEELNAFSDGVNQFILLVVMFVIKQMELIKGRTSNLPMRFLVQIAKGNGVGKKLVELLGHFQAHGLFQFERDRKSTRLNSSHTVISYAVFC